MSSLRKTISINLALLVALFIVAALSLEVWDRTFSQKTDDRLAQFNQALGNTIDPQYRADAAKVHGAGIEYHDYHLLTIRPFQSPTINFGDYSGLKIASRFVPANALAKSHSRPLRVWFFGGSTMQNLEAPDNQTIANTAIKFLNENGNPAIGLNFGVGGFQSSLEVTKFSDLLRRSMPEHLPDLAVFYDGYNDWVFSLHSGAGKIGEDYRSRVRSVLERDYPALFMYATSQWIASHSVAWSKRIHGNTTLWFFARSAAATNDERASTAAVRAYVANTRIASALGKEFGVSVSFFLQPMLLSKQPLTPFEKEYAARASQAEIEHFNGFYSGVPEAMKDQAFL